jgi:valyl-tRNA synthetase
LDHNCTAPEGCAIVPVSDVCEAYMMLKGLIDVNKEIERLQSKQEKISAPLIRLKASTEVTDYEEKVPLEVRTANNERLRQMQTELNKVMDAIKAISFIKD